MNICINIPSLGIRDQARFPPDVIHQQQSLIPILEWRLFLRMIEALCKAYDWELEYQTPEDALCATFASAV